ncbi:glycoside hydrolase family 2 [Bacteroides salyersiae]|uniref:glycoside hydrolase family 2 protein n=1 Tax=Bacteroides salyersiae TaxID=291644 RepID=UPI00101BE334|nr:sugar-binding domain-containing protein [Bacteroides salyersiae]KAB5348598.1 glycoside hydrolase family 2 [Bacteroides salyersiae]KAB5355040.1 glycoside hydrolase family 2 [Bacteroides salyersiae]KAB5370035.1 glycoside hydrolase family 2 [Bacteroides salyersiae]KAB5378883.1 glycoside hydrolase family 2 [Bacteroides salyersiae]KAB5387859.1 glycoside hydrolase family 2 [Bacteroides salyersiae]
MIKNFLLSIFLLLIPSCFWGNTAYRPQVSVAGFIPLSGSGRDIYNFNPGWRYYKGDMERAETVELDDSDWEVVATPHSVELMPAEASGCRNYQGPVWYRKWFVIPAATRGKQVFIHFEAVMGKQKVYLNGHLVKEHLGGYLPFNIDLTANGIQAGDSCLIAVMADNSDDKSYPPGKRQYTLDFSYHGGIYRDVWMIAKSDVSITDAVDAGKVAGGGVFIHYGRISEKKADILIDTEVRNNGKRQRKVEVESSLVDATGTLIKRVVAMVHLDAGQSKTVNQKIEVRQPHLWSPDSPYLYRVESRVKEGKNTLDGGITRAGIRKAEFKGKEGFWLNGKPFGQLIGANRHQDFAYVGNALPNSGQWRDAKKLRDAGCRIIRVAHYPQDPSFMDACDELGMFVIVATPGWQYWNKEPEFARLVHENTRQMIRRDRNHACVLMWEPILNETRYPLDFALEALRITKEEYPYPGRPVAAADVHSAGVEENYDVVYGWPGDDEKTDSPEQCIFTREYGENVDDWYAHNNNNRASRSWGERPLLVQALSLAKSYDEMYRTTGKFIGGAQWHPFDHQRGYHPDPYWGGIFDAFRQPKYAYHMYRSQTAPDLNHPLAECGPVVYIAHEMSQFSDADVVVFSNCDSVRLSVYDGTKSWTLPVIHAKGHMPNAPVVFKNVWNFWEARDYSYVQKKWQKVNILAEGIINGKVVCAQKKMPSRRSTKLRLRIDSQGVPLVADGSDFVVVIAEVTDDNGNVRRLAKENIVFTIEGEGEIIGDRSINANPRTVEFGTAPVLVRSTSKAGKIRIKAHVQFEGTHAPTPAEIEFESVDPEFPSCYIEQRMVPKSNVNPVNNTRKTVLTEEEKRHLLMEVEKQQTEFGVNSEK